MNLPVMVCAVLAVLGAGLVAVTLLRLRRTAPDFGDFFEQLDYRDDQERLLAQPFLTRVVGGSLRAATGKVETLLPSKYVATVRHQLAQAGLSRKRTAGQQISVQIGLALAGALLVPLLPPGSPISGGPAA
jgi:hypothetical protein